MLVCANIWILTGLSIYLNLLTLKRSNIFYLWQRARISHWHANDSKL